MAITRQNLVDSPDWKSPHDPLELTFVEVWEHLPSATYYIWNNETGDLRELDHRGHKDFMDAAIAAEDAMIAASNPGRMQALEQARANNSSRRVVKSPGTRGSPLTRLP